MNECRANVGEGGGGTNETTERPRLLVADDDPAMRFLAKAALEPAGFEVEGAPDGSAALAAFEQQRPELALLDVNMPGLNGFEVCAAIRRTPGGESTPVLMMTGSDDIESIRRAYEAGATDFTTKPVNWLILEHRVRYMLRAGRTLLALRNSEDRQQALLNAIPDMMMRIRRDGTLIDVHASKAGLPPSLSEAVHRRLGELLPSDIAERFLRALADALASSNTQVFEYRWVIEGETREYEARTVASGEDTVLTIVRDITDRKRLEEELRQAQKLEALGALAGGIAHDFNNVLTVINGYGGLMKAAAGDQEPLARQLTTVLEAAEHATALTRQLLAFSRKQIVEPRVVQLSAAVAKLERLLRRLIGEDIELAVALSPDVYPVLIDPGNLEQIVFNLAINARDAIAGTGRLTIRTRNMVSLETGVVRVLLEIEDTGQGMNEETRQRIWDPFFTTKSQGTGLGLATVHRIVEDAGGEIEVESAPGLGTTFRVSLPPAQSGTGPPLESAKASAARGSGIILVAEDEEVIRELMIELLQLEGYQALVAADGGDALAIARTYEGPIHLLLTDVVMPVMGGRELADALRRDRPEIKVLYTSGYTDETLIERGVETSEAGFLRKPFTPATLLLKLRELLDCPPHREPSSEKLPPAISEAQMAHRG